MREASEVERGRDRAWEGEVGLKQRRRGEKISTNQRYRSEIRGKGRTILRSHQTLHCRRERKREGRCELELERIENDSQRERRTNMGTHPRWVQTPTMTSLAGERE